MAQPLFELVIKRVVADLAEVGAVFTCPAIRRFRRVHKIQNVLADAIPLKANFSGDNTLLGGSRINRAVCGGSKLHTEFSVKDHAVNGVGEGTLAHAVKDHVPYGDLAKKRLSFCLGTDDAREPIDLVASVMTTARGDRTSAARDSKAVHAVTPFDACIKGAVKLKDRRVHNAVFHENRLIVIKISAVGNDVVAPVGTS